MSKPFLIRNPETRLEFELTDVGYFVSHYQPQGFEIVSPAPHGYVAPELPHDAPVVTEEQVPELDLSAMTRAELDTYAASIGVRHPEELPNKGLVIDAIQDQTANAQGDGHPPEVAS